MIRTQLRLHQGTIVNAAYRYRRDALAQPGLEQTDLSFVIPVNRNWNLYGRWNYSLRDNQTIEALAGFGERLVSAWHGYRRQVAAANPRWLAVNRGRVEEARAILRRSDPANADATLAAVDRDLEAVDAAVENMEFRRMFSNPMDPNNCFLDIQAGSGGTTEQLLARRVNGLEELRVFHGGQRVRTDSSSRRSFSRSSALRSVMTTSSG